MLRMQSLSTTNDNTGLTKSFSASTELGKSVELPHGNFFYCLQLKLYNKSMNKAGLLYWALNVGPPTGYKYFIRYAFAKILF
jgi:hypothetical protein